MLTSRVLFIQNQKDPSKYENLDQDDLFKET